MLEHNVTNIIANTDDAHKSDVISKINVLFSKYEEELSILIQNYDIDLQSIISWDFEKITFLSSEDITDVINRFDNQDIFQEIEGLYDRDHELAGNIVDKILASEEDLTGMDFEDLQEKYVHIVQNMELPDQKYYDMEDTNIIDLIVRDENYDPEDARVGFALLKSAGVIDSCCSTPRTSYSDEDNSSIESSDDNSIASVGQVTEYEDTI